MKISTTPDPRLYTNFHARSQMLLNSSFILNHSSVYQSSISNSSLQSSNKFDLFHTKRRTPRFSRSNDPLSKPSSPLFTPKSKIKLEKIPQIQFPINEKIEIPKFQHTFYKKFIDMKSLGYKCNQCKKIQCKCEGKSRDEFVLETTKKIKLLIKKRNHIINEINDGFQFKHKKIVPRIGRSFTPKFRCKTSKDPSDLVEIARKLMKSDDDVEI
ncbi:unnamed protein product [Blepharisma stoltei]|uniref:Uncharacterized protein n=1 Tax=Blepharisma stoltei TaxID=1481888 RepID=A0AAU9K7W5_9CILI|nr:unnamed protein product [Blepharisma stoltei]